MYTNLSPPLWHSHKANLRYGWVEVAVCSVPLVGTDHLHPSSDLLVFLRAGNQVNVSTYHYHTAAWSLCLHSIHDIWHVNCILLICKSKQNVRYFTCM